MGTSELKLVLAICWALSLGGCGLHVPEIQEFPGDAREGQRLVNAIVYNITCEVQDAVADAYRVGMDHPRSKLFLDTWGAQITLNLTVEEKTAVAPTASVLSGTLFTLGLGGTLSSDATRIIKLNSYYTISDLRKLGRCLPETRPATGAYLLANDLKLKELLYDSVTAADTGGIQFANDTLDGPFKQNVISQEVKFEILSSGNLTPTWKLARATVNPTGTLFSTSRDRIQDLTITLGPTDKTGKAPSVAAVNAALASDIGVAITNGVRNGISQ